SSSTVSTASRALSRRRRSPTCCATCGPSATRSRQQRQRQPPRRNRSAGQGVLDRADDLGGVRLLLRTEALDLSIRQHEELLEVPLDAAALTGSIRGLLESFVQVDGASAVDLHLVGERESHAVRRRAELLNLL